MSDSLHHVETERTCCSHLTLVLVQTQICTKTGRKIKKPQPDKTDVSNLHVKDVCHVTDATRLVRDKKRLQRDVSPQETSY